MLKDELTNDPLARGYAGMTDQQVADDMNTAYRDLNRVTMLASEVLNAIDKTEFNAVTADQQRQVWDILHMGAVNPFGLEADLFIDIFGGGSATITTLAAARKTLQTRAIELGLGRVLRGHVIEARA